MDDRGTLRGLMLGNGCVRLSGTRWRVACQESPPRAASFQRAWRRATGWDGTTTGDIDAFPVPYQGAGGHEPGTQVWGGGGAIDIDALADNPQNTWGIGLIARWTVSPTLKVTGNAHYISTVEEGVTGFASPVGDGNISGVDSVGTEVGVKIDYTLARGLVATLVAGRLALGGDVGRTAGGVVTTFDSATKVAAVLNYSF